MQWVPHVNKLQLASENRWPRGDLALVLAPTSTPTRGAHGSPRTKYVVILFFAFVTKQE